MTVFEICLIVVAAIVLVGALAGALYVIRGMVAFVGIFVGLLNIAITAR